jgi:hypothetical protein
MSCNYNKNKKAEVAQGVPGRLRPWIISTFSTTRVVGHNPYAPAAFTPGEIPGCHFQRLSRPPGHMVLSEGTMKKSPLTPPGIDPGTVWLVVQRLNHYATPVTTIQDKKKGKAVPLQAWSGPESSRKLWFPDFMTMAQDGGKVVSLTHRRPLPPGNTPGTCFR